MRKKLVVGNWKMHGTRASNAVLLAGLKEAGPWNAQVVVCVRSRTSRTRRWR